MGHRSRQARRTQVIALAAIAVAFTIGGLIWLGDGDGSGSRSAPASQPAGFVALSVADTNRCDLAAAEVRSMPDSMRLQGSCCSAMERSRYRGQLRGLHPYARREHRIVPTDPYDVPVALAKRLLADRTIALDAGQQAIYDRARSQSELGGPAVATAGAGRPSMGRPAS